MKTKLKDKTEIKDIIIKHITDNIKEYATVVLIFFISIIVGIIFINNINDEQQVEINNYINNFINSVHQNSTINFLGLLKESITTNIFLTICMWFAGCTVIGMPIVYGIIAFRGFCVGYTVSSIIATLGTGKGLAFSMSTILLQNLLLIPAIFALSVSGIRLYKSIMKDKRRENIKLEVLRHTAFSAMMCVVMILASFVETYVSSNIFMNIVEFM